MFFSVLRILWASENARSFISNGVGCTIYKDLLKRDGVGVRSIVMLNRIFNYVICNFICIFAVAYKRLYRPVHKEYSVEVLTLESPIYMKEDQSLMLRTDFVPRAFAVGHMGWGEIRFFGSGPWQG